MRVLVTGGHGFIGGVVVRKLLEDGQDVVVLDNLDPSVHRERPQEHPGALYLQGDVRDHADAKDALSGVDRVVHMAAKVGIEQDLSELGDYTSTNTQGTAVLLSEMHKSGVHELALASSMVVYGEGTYLCLIHGEVVPPARTRVDLDDHDYEMHCPLCGRDLQPGLVGEGGRLDPKSAYALSKLSQEQLVSHWVRQGNKAVVLRYHNVYGPLMPRDTPYSGVAALWRSQLERGEAPQVFEDGSQRRDFVHVADVADATILAGQSLTSDPTPSLRVYNVASGTPRTILEFAQSISTAMDGPEPEVTHRWRTGDVRHVTASTDKIQDDLGFAARVDLETGVEEFVRSGLRP